MQNQGTTNHTPIPASRRGKAFTVVELMVSLVVTSVLLSAVATLAFALNAAETAGGDTVVKQAQLRQATLRVSELIRNGLLLCATPGDDLAVWRADTNLDGQINVDELVYIERGSDHKMLRLCQFLSGVNPTVPLASLALATTKADLIAAHSETFVSLIPACSSVQFAFDVLPPRARLLTLSFEVTENNAVRQYETNIALRAWAGHLLNAAGDALVSDDD